jgi:hypothetical protein
MRNATATKPAECIEKAERNAPRRRWMKEADSEVSAEANSANGQRSTANIARHERNARAAECHETKGPKSALVRRRWSPENAEK